MHVNYYFKWAYSSKNTYITFLCIHQHILKNISNVTNFLETLAFVVVTIYRKQNLLLDDDRDNDEIQNCEHDKTECSSC